MGFQNYKKHPSDAEADPHRQTRPDWQETRVDNMQDTRSDKSTGSEDESATVMNGWALVTRVDDPDATPEQRKEQTKRTIRDVWDEEEDGPLAVEAYFADEKPDEPQDLSESYDGLYLLSNELPLPLGLLLPQGNQKKNASRFLDAFRKAFPAPRVSDLSISSLLFNQALDTETSISDHSEQGGITEQRFLISSEGSLVILGFDTHQNTCWIECIFDEYRA